MSKRTTSTTQTSHKTLQDDLYHCLNTGPTFVISPTAEARYCLSGTRYHKIIVGGLLINGTVAENCFSDCEAAQIEVSAHNSHRRNVQSVIWNAKKTTCVNAVKVPIFRAKLFMANQLVIDVTMIGKLMQLQSG